MTQLGSFSHLCSPRRVVWGPISAGQERQNALTSLILEEHMRIFSRMQSRRMFQGLQRHIPGHREFLSRAIRVL